MISVTAMMIRKVERAMITSSPTPSTNEPVPEKLEVSISCYSQVTRGLIHIGRNYHHALLFYIRKF